MPPMQSIYYERKSLSYHLSQMLNRRRRTRVFNGSRNEEGEPRSDVKVGLIQGRHVIEWQEEEVADYVWSEVPAERVNDFEWLERQALGWLNKLSKKQQHIRLFVTGLTTATVAFLKMYDVVYMHRPNPPSLSLMFWDRDQEDYVESRWDE